MIAMLRCLNKDIDKADVAQTLQVFRDQPRVTPVRMVLFLSAVGIVWARLISENEREVMQQLGYEWHIRAITLGASCMSALGRLLGAFGRLSLTLAISLLQWLVHSIGLGERFLLLMNQ
jgi:hypothetical protein